MRRSPCPLQSDQWRAGRAFGLSGCGGSRFFFPAIFPCHAQGALLCRTISLQFTRARAYVHDRGVPAARLDRNRFGLGVGMGAV